MGEESTFLEDEKLRLEDSEKIQREIISLKMLFHKVVDTIAVPVERIDFIDGKRSNIVSGMNELLNYIPQLGELNKSIKNEIHGFLNSQKENLKNVKTFNHFNKIITDFDEELKKILNSVLKSLQIVQLQNFENSSRTYIKTLNNKIENLNSLIDDQKNIKVHKIFEDDSKNFKFIARIYEVAFYSIVAVLILYFLGLTFYINDFKFLFIHMGFPEKIHGNLSLEFYIQKISLLVLSMTLAAFLLKRSFMNRRLADDAYRIAKELDALPRYMEGMPDEMKEKIRFDLAYKYFGNGIHHEIYTGGENLMHENIKANADFIKAVKDLSSKAEKPQADKPE